MSEVESKSETEPDGVDKPYSRREALTALAKYSVALGGSATTIVTAEGLVSAASAYPDWLRDFCQANPGHWICTWDGWDRWDRGRGQGSGRGRIRY